MLLLCDFSKIQANLYLSVNMDSKLECSTVNADIYIHFVNYQK